ncbi:TPR repeat-containing protein [Desulfatibacillum aliphaticivorans]|uniref:TPR repeat-containing protein n=1 Tax=Desulfatibacillum aliphaticivorans TaxID=218208 RepID=B8FGL2_DESAL|nr:hypothetical protein [Desulfatibacillum aliphaticivorans]ACL04921.1 TPR repeat-containing protein [Desulfatibacillum aliphaticivorans]
MHSKKPVLRAIAFGLLAMLLLCPALSWAQEDAPSFALAEKSFEELGEMEFTANSARELFWKGEFSQALEIYEGLCLENHASASLYWSEKAMCHLAMDDYQQAENCLFKASMYSETFYDPKLEKKALSKYGQEGEKIYIGDPYERSLQYLILALLFMDEGDYDNALAACKSGLLADSDAVENLYQSDLTLLYLLEAKCHVLRGDQETANLILDRARESYRTTSPELRGLFSQRLDELAKLKLTKKERKKLKIKETDEDIRARIEALTGQINQASAAVPVDEKIGGLLSTDYNTLILLPVGQCPEKMRKGKNANIIYFQPQNSDSGIPQVFVDGEKVQAPLYNNVAEVDFQATTRGGRRMDAILNGQAAFRQTTLGVGEAITEIGNQAGGVVGLGVALVGAAIQGAAGAVNPEADTRCWQNLPAKYELYAFSLPPGEHQATFQQYIYFQKCELKKSFVLESENDVAVLFAPPSPADLCCASNLCVRKKRENPLLVLAPPLGFSQIETFVSQDPKAEPQSFAPDAKKISRMLDRFFHKEGVPCTMAGHEEILQDRIQAAAGAKFALQIEPKSFSYEKIKKEQQYASRFAFTLIDIQTGRPVLEQFVEGTWLKTKKDKKKGCTEAFYECLKQAAQTFITNSETQQALNKDAAA